MKNEKLFIQAFRQIRSLILENDLRPGSLLPSEATLCQQIGVSRNVLREAIKSMELMGIVEACPGKGTVVKEFNLDFVFRNVMFATGGDDSGAIREMLGIRKKIELGYMREAYHLLTDADVRYIRATLEEIKAKWRNHVFFHADDRDFHMALFAHLGNKTLLSLLDAIWAVDANFKSEEKIRYLDDTVAKHEAIVLALEHHNEEAFAAAMLAHFASGKYSSGGTFSEY